MERDIVRIASAVDGVPTVEQIDGMLASLTPAERHSNTQLVDDLLEMRQQLVDAG